MTIDYDKIKEIIEQAVGVTAGQDMEYLIYFIAISAFIGISTLIITTYLKQIAGDFAKKTHIQELTEKVEEIKTAHQEQIALYTDKLQRLNTLDLVALEKKFEKRQEAFTLWYELNRALDDDADIDGKIINESLGSIVERCENWWAKNCFYLEEDAKNAFKGAYSSASYITYFKNLAINDTSGEKDSLVQNCRDDVKQLGRILSVDFREQYSKD